MTASAVVWVIVAAAVFALAGTVAAWLGIRASFERRVRSIAGSILEAATKPARPCYRCAAVATKEFMGLHYCLMCREMVSRVYPAAVHDPPFGFPGSRGYLEFPAEEKTPS